MGEQQVTIAQAVHLALDHHRAGRLREAESIYRQILASEPNNVDALHFLGVLAHQSGHHQAAIDSIERAIALHPGVVEHHINVAGPYRALKKPAEAVRHLQRAIELRPNDAMAHNAIAATYIEMGRMDQAADHWRKLVDLEPKVASHPSNLAVWLERLGKLDEALALCQRSLAIDPNYPSGHNNLGSILNKLGRLNEAIAEHQRAVELKPDFADAWINLASAEQEAGHINNALRAAKRAAELRPTDATPFRLLALATEEQGKLDIAQQAYDHAIKLLQEKTRNVSSGKRTDDVDWLNRLRVLRTIMMPPVYTSMAELESRRAQVADGMKRLRNMHVRLHLEPEPAPVLFQLAYHGRDDRAIAEDYTSLVVPAYAGDLSKPPKRSGSGGKIHVAMISRFFKEHTIGRLNRGLVAQLNRDEFEVTVISIGDPGDPISQFVKQHADRFVPIAPIVKPAREAVEAIAPDILFFTDLGMDPITFSIAFTRMAPVQCVTWGHPVTTAIPTMDYFISSEVLDPPGNEAHYTEKLVRLPELGVYYYRPTLTLRKTRADFGLPDDATLYGCLQMLWKFHPEFDEPIAEILRRDPKGRLVLIHGLNTNWDNLLTERFRRVMPDVADRVTWVPRLNYDEFLALTALCDVMLDPIHFGGGNTTYEALAFNVPVITRPSPFMRGRLTPAMYQMMQMDDCVASTIQDYVDRAVAIAARVDRREVVRAKIAERSPVLFENSGAVRSLEAFFRRAVS